MPTVSEGGYYLKGYVYTRGVVEDDDGTQYFAEYDPETGELRNHFPATGAYALDQVSLMSGTQYRSYVERFEVFKKQFYDAEKLAKPEGNGQENPPILIKRQELLSTQFTLLAGQGGEEGITFHFRDSDLQDNTRYILLRPPVLPDAEDLQYYSVTGGSADTGSLKRAIILMQSPVNPEETIGDGVLSLLINKDSSDIDSRVVKTSTNNLGMLTSFAEGVEGAKKYDDSEDWIRSRLQSDDVTDFERPIKDVFVENYSMFGPVVANTGEDGFYSMTYGELMLPTCLVGSWDTYLTFKLRSLSFNPRFKKGYPYWVQLPQVVPCKNDWHFYFGPSTDLMSSMTHLTLVDLGNQFTASRTDYLVDMKVLTGEAQLSNEQWSLDVTNPDNPITYRGQAMDPATRHAWSPPGWDASIQVSEDQATTYKVNDPREADYRLANQHYDFDGDGKRDLATIGQLACTNNEGQSRVIAYEEMCEAGETRQFVFDQTATSQGKIAKSTLEDADKPYYQGVFYSSQVGETINMPPVIRLLDDAINDYHQGLVEVIAREDLRNTDIYVFRESTGDLLTERSGLSPAELRPDDGSSNDFDEADGNFHYRLQLRGGEEGYFRVGSRGRSAAYKDGEFVGYEAAFNTWQIDSGMNPKFHEREADHIRPGEPVRIILINRATGYMGSARTVLDVKDSITSLPSIWVPDIKMGPPNLKVWAEREFYVESGLTKDEGRQFLIGSEGAANASDLIIKVYTEWLDQDGSPLPEQLSDFGYTARVGKLTAASQVSDMSVESENGQSVRYFPIKPGKHLQLIRVSESGTGTQHLYVQVNGEPYIRSPDFSGDPKVNIEINRETNSPGVDFETLGAGDAQLISRPMRYVPVLTPIWDENTTLENQLYYNQWKNKQEEEDNQQVVNPLKPDPHYKWRYRPEFHFSIYDINPRDIRTYEETEDSIISGSIIDAATPTISSGDEFIKFIYDLGDEVAAPNPLFSTEEKELILALGEEEIKLTYGSNNEVLISNLEHLAGLEAEDFLTARLYTNNDASNILWEWAFEYLYIESATIGYNNQTDDTWYVTADDPTVDLKAGLIGYAYRSDEAKYNPVVTWFTDGAGSFGSAAQSSPELGLFDNTLTMPAEKGKRALVSAQINGTDSTAQWKSVEVLAGKPAHISITQSGEAVGLDQGDVRLDIEVTDGSSFKNPVEDGTDVSIEFADSLLVKDQQLSTVDGKAYIVLTGGEYQEDNTKVTVTSGEVSSEHNLYVAPLTIELDASSTLLTKGETVTVNATVTKPDGTAAVGVPVSLSASRGFFSGQELTTDDKGQVTTTFTAGLNETADTWIAQVGYLAVTQLDYQVQSLGLQSINAQDTLLVADTDQAGSVDFDAYGILTSAAFETTATVQVKGAIGDTVTLGDMADPNLEPLLSLPMNQIDSNGDYQQFNDDHGLHPAIASGAAIVFDHPLGAGRSTQLSSDSAITIEPSTALALSSEKGFRVDIKPQGEGTLVRYTDKLALHYSQGMLEASLDINNETVTVSGSADQDKWHRVAVKVTADTLQLYVDGEIYSSPLASAMTETEGSIQLGGAPTVIRGFKVFDYSSQPLISFADGATTAQLTDTSETLTVKSLGNLGKTVEGSQLQSHRVAIITDTQRNYASLLTQTGYEVKASQYLFTASPVKPPIAAAVNPLSPLVSSAYAWSWDGVWSGVKSTVGFLIPYEDFIVIGQQLVYLVNQDWENFDPVALAFASLGAATILPVAKPLIPLLKPLRKVVNGMRRFPGAKFFAGAIGKATKSGLGGKTQRLLDLLPFILIAVELYEEPEVFEFMMSAIENEDDLWVWVDYMAEAIAQAGLDPQTTYSQQGQSEQVAVNPLRWIISSAQAANSSSKVKAAAEAVIARIRIVRKGIPLYNASLATGALRIGLKNPTLRKVLVKSGSALKVFAVLGGAKIQRFIANSKNWRINRWLVAFCVTYLTNEYDKGFLQLDSESNLVEMISAVFSGNKSRYNGGVFQIVQTAYFHALNRADSSKNPRIKGIATPRAAYHVIDGLQAPSTRYAREVDIVLEKNDDSEKWIELKSYADSTASASAFTNKIRVKKTANYREFFHDMRLSDGFINLKNRNKILESGVNGNSEYVWYFHDYAVPKGSRNRAIAPDTAKLDKIQKWLCRSPKDLRSKEDFYKNNFSGNVNTIDTKCANKADELILLRNTNSYLKEILEKIGTESATKFMNAVNGLE